MDFAYFIINLFLLKWLEHMVKAGLVSLELTLSHLILLLLLLELIYQREEIVFLKLYLVVIYVDTI